MCLSGPTIIFGAVGVVPFWVFAAGVCVVVDEVVGAVVVPLCVWLEPFEAAAGAAVVVELPLFFFALAVDVVCAPAIDPVIRNALIQKLAANFKYLFIDVLSRTGFGSYTLSSTPAALPLRRYNFRVNPAFGLRPSACCVTNEVFQSVSADLNFMQSG